MSISTILFAIAVSTTLLILLFILIIICEKRKQKQQITFKDAMELTDLPIVTFYCNGVKLHFLLDTGSNQSHINSAVLNNIEYEKMDNTIEVVGMEGNIKTSSVCRIKISYKENVFEENFVVNDLTKIFEVIKTNTHIQIHGILGTDFFNKYKYVIDFNNLVAYSIH